MATCGTIARALGDVSAARAVATWVLAHPEVPGAHRVVRADGRPVLRSAHGPLRTDGVPPPGDRADASRFEEALPDIGLLRRFRGDQERLSRGIVEEGDPGALETVGGVDAAYVGEHAHVAAVVCDAESLEPRETAVADVAVEFPYIPTYLAYRELPPIEEAFSRLRTRPDVLLIDGHGRLHPALFGIACLAGLRLGLPTIGVAKHPLRGRPAPGRRRRDGAIPLEIDGVVRGYAWRPPRGSRPLYVSVGHGLSLDAALRIVRETTRDRHPEPLRIADLLAKKRKDVKNGKGGS